MTFPSWWALTLIACSLFAGCGLTQTVTDGTVSITKSIFYKKIKTLHLDFTPRTAINADGAQTPLATMVRVYQLRDRKAVDAADYQTLLRRADTVLKDDVLASKALLVMPNGSVTLNMPMDEDAQFVAVVGLFARTGPLSLKASEGPVEMQAQNASLQLFAEKKLMLSSAVDILFVGKKRITLIGGGSYLKLEAGKVEYGTTAMYLRRVKRTMAAGAASIPVKASTGGGICLSCLMKAAMNGDTFVIRGES
ncbi:type VI secretion system lipoprotein TssJ [Klebsiella pneumoniae]|uniref:type VI secretion system lipoprotein TssJ n=1 Tax=Klebsiella pneumoniae TaxID=573 RepID=UPI0038712C2B